ncbi:MAG: transposase [Gemmatimonadales bacterium]|nr:transposase [Gemmatimonadales bacterium]
MAKRTDGVAAVRERAIGRLDWQAAQRDDQRVAQAIHEGEELDAVHELSEAGLLDEFFAYLEALGIPVLISSLVFPNVERVLIPLAQFVTLYLVKTLYGIESMHALPPLLFSNVALMTLLGFNATQIAEGYSRRGDDKRQRKPKQGPLSPQCLAQNICKLPPEQLAAFFNGVVRRMVASGLLEGDLLVALDGSKVLATEQYQGRGCLALPHEQRVKLDGVWTGVKVVERLFGWKVVVLIEVRTRLPLAMLVTKIEAYEGAFLLPLLEQAQANLGEHARIVKVVADRGYLDGQDLWALDQRGITFVVVAKSGMHVRADAQALARTEQPVERVQVVRHGRGRTAWTETLVTRLVGISGLTSYDAYGPAAHAAGANRTDFVGNPLNAVVVLTWNNREYPDGGTVYLTNGPVKEPFVVFDDYDWRSVIENGIFKEGKHPWHLEHAPQKTEAAVVLHCYFTLLVMALCTAFRLQQAREAAEAQQADAGEPDGPATAAETLSSVLLGGEGTARWRRRLKQENRDKVIVFIGAWYGIFHLAELAILSGLRLRTLPPELGSRAAVFARYGLAP